MIILLDKNNIELEREYLRIPISSFNETGKALESLNKKVSVEIKNYYKDKSKEAVNYCWLLCGKLAEKLLSTKEEIYKEMIRQVGKFKYVPVKSDRVEKEIADWEREGTGYQAFDRGKATSLPGHNVLQIYFGCHGYNSKEMSVLIEEIVTQAKENDIEVKPEKEIESMLKYVR